MTVQVLVASVFTSVHRILLKEGRPNKSIAWRFLSLAKVFGRFVYHYTLYYEGICGDADVHAFPL